MTTALEVFEAARPRLTGLAYRLLGSWAEAEDVVQEAWLRWAEVDIASVRNAEAFLTTVVTRRALTELDSARVRREQYVGPWLPEPVDTSADPTLGAETSELLDFASLLLLERLSGPERAAVVLRDAFAYDYPSLAQVLEVSVSAARQLVSRGRRAIEGERRQPVDAEEQLRFVRAFVEAAEGGDLGALEALLTSDAVAVSDGGGLASAARRPVRGAEQVARFVLGVLEKFAQGSQTIPVNVNGTPALLTVTETSAGPKALALTSFSIDATGVRAVHIVRNPLKISRIAASVLSQDH